MEVTQLNVRIPIELSEQIRQVAFDKRTTKKDLIIKYIEEGIKRETRQTTLDG